MITIFKPFIYYFLITIRCWASRWWGESCNGPYCRQAVWRLVSTTIQTGPWWGPGWKCCGRESWVRWEKVLSCVGSWSWSPPCQTSHSSSPLASHWNWTCAWGSSCPCWYPPWSCILACLLPFIPLLFGWILKFNLKCSLKFSANRAKENYVLCARLSTDDR